MSDIAATARVSLVLADYAAANEVNKVNVLGAGWQVTRLLPETGATAPMGLLVMIDVAPSHYGQPYGLEVTLLDEVGQMVEVPGPTGMSPLRIGQSVEAETPVFPGQYVPKNALWAHAQFVANFPGGLPLRAGGTYTWRVRIDLDDAHLWELTFHVAGPPPPAVLG